VVPQHDRPAVRRRVPEQALAPPGEHCRPVENLRRSRRERPEREARSM
jgi:hypothetical protein